MAEPAKEFNKPKPQIRKPSPTEPDSQWQEFERWIFYIAIALLLYFIFTRIQGFFSGTSFFRTIAHYPWQTILLVVKMGAVGLSAWGIYGIIKLVPRMMVLRLQLTASPELPGESGMTRDEKEIHRAWRAVLEQLASENASDWKLAVMSADAVTDEALIDIKLEGETMADRLKTLGESRRLRSYETVWDAHKVRNEIAHDPRRLLSQEEARRVIQYYEEALKELGAM